jgi:hypothetical protein
VNLACEGTPYYASLWWKDIRDLYGRREEWCWLEDLITKRLGNGMQTCFWKEVWVGDSPLCFNFPRLFMLSVHQDACVGELCCGRRHKEMEFIMET